MRSGADREVVFFLERMLSPLRTVKVELLLQEMINRAINRKRKSGNTFDAKLVVDEEAARTFKKKIDLRTRKLPVIPSIVPCCSPVCFIKL
jgi:hypothetical protein